MNTNELAACLYDWHNQYLLNHQMNDIIYYKNCIKKYNAKTVLIIGAGTGRVAIPLSSAAEIYALDKDHERLNRLVNKNKNITIIRADICEFIPSQKFDLIISPYSTIQLISPGIQLTKCYTNIYNLLYKNGKFLFDLSTHFNEKKDTDWVQKLDKYNNELNCNIQEWQKIIRLDNSILLLIKYYKDKKDIILELSEKWYYYNPENIKKLLKNYGLKEEYIDQGYGEGVSIHRRIYHTKKV